MKVQALINALAHFDPDLEVIIPSEAGTEFCALDSVLPDLVRFIGADAQLTDERDSDRVAVVRLFGPD